MEELTVPPIHYRQTCEADYSFAAKIVARIDLPAGSVDGDLSRIETLRYSFLPSTACDIFSDCLRKVAS